MIIESAISFILMGAFFGLSAGISPGPLLTLVISETLKHNRMEGIKVAISPLITDIPIIIITYLIFSRISQIEILNIISIAGGLYFTFLGYETLNAKAIDINSDNPGPHSLRKGIVANLLNPHPYLFWLTIGIPTAKRAYNESVLTVVFYFFLFYILLTGSKILIALLVEKSKGFLKNSAYRISMYILGITLFLFAAIFIHNGIKDLVSHFNK